MKERRITLTNVLDGGGYAAVLLFLTAFFVRLFFLAFSDNFFGEQPMLKLITALHIFERPAPSDNIHFLHLPYYLYSLAAAVWLGKEQIVCARFLSLLFGSLSVVSLYFLAGRIYGKKTAVLSGILAVCVPLAVIKSVVTLPDTIVLFLLLQALYFFSLDKTIPGALTAALAGGFDYLGAAAVIIFAAGAALTKKFNRQDVRTAFIILAAGGLFPLAWAAGRTIIQGNAALLFNLEPKPQSIFGIAFLVMKNIREFVSELTRFYPLLPALLSAGGIAYHLFKGKRQELLFIAALMIVFLAPARVIFYAGIVPVSSGMTLVTVLLVPYAAEAIRLIGEFFKSGKIIIVPALTVFLCFDLLVTAAAQKPRLPERVKNTAAWLSKNLTGNEDIRLAKDKAGYYSSVIMLSGLPQGKFRFISKKDILSVSRDVTEREGYLMLLEEQALPPESEEGYSLITAKDIFPVYRIEPRL